MSKLVIFDFDGVFYSSEYIWVGSLLHFLLVNNVDISESEAFQLFAGTSVKSKRDYIWEHYALDISEEKNREIIKAKEKELMSSEEKTKGIGDVFEFLHQNNIKICIATGAKESGVLRRINNWGFDKYFSKENLTTAYEVEEIGGKGKPEPDVFLLAGEKMGFEPKNCIVIEDSKQGLQAGLSAKMEVIAFFEHQHDIPEITSWAKEKNIKHITYNADELLKEIKKLV